MTALLIARNTVLQLVRQKTFYNLAVFGVAAVVFGLVVGNITYGSPQRIVRSIGLSGVSLALDLMALLLGVGLVNGEIQSRTLFVIITRRVSRAAYIAGRYAGLTATLALALVGLSFTYAALLMSVRGEIGLPDLQALAMALVEAALVGGIGVVLSCITTPTLGAGMGLGIWVAAATVDDVVKLTVVSNPELTPVAESLAWLLPALNRINVRTDAVHGVALGAADFAQRVGYAGCYVVLFWGLATATLSRREML
jgi:ABC-type transport system involved in multi-copper enzyme maturation permease subunit